MSMLEAALELAARGWPVHPCKPGCKAPDTPHAWQDATIDPDVIRAWWSHTPDRNIAIATGAPAVDVLDVDVSPEVSGYAAFNRAQAAGLLAGAVRLVSTPRGGLHAYYAGTEQRGSRLSRHGLDFKAAGGYVLAPPSIVDERDEKARDDPSRRGVYELVQQRDTAPARLDWPAIKRLLDPPRRASTPRTARGSAGRAPASLADRLSRTDVDDRSAYFHGSVALARRAGLTQDQTVTVLTPWCEAVGKYTNRVDVEVARSWEKLEDAR